MCTVRELKDYLDTLPEDATVKVVSEYMSSYNAGCGWVDLDVDEPSDSCEFIGSHNTIYLGV